MTKLYIKQKVFSFGDKYNIYNEDGQPVFSVQGEVFTFGAKIHIYDDYWSRDFFIEQKCSDSFLNNIFSGNTLCYHKKGILLLLQS